jgi:murein DD-endopeptidase MepM/ murein hydrolase activator NlpD
VAALLGVARAGIAQTDSQIRTRLTFPIPGVKAYEARITSILDHDRQKWGVDGSKLVPSPLRAESVGTIVSWLGERARKADGSKNYNSSVMGYGGDGKAYPRRLFRAHGGDNYLWYENTSKYEHPGYDYGHTGVIVAPADGDVYIVKTDPLFGGGWKGYHTFRIEHADGLSTWFLHCSRFVKPSDKPGAGDWDGVVKSVIGIPAYDGKTTLAGDMKVGRVKRNEPLALIGTFGAGAVHLHLEVRRRDAQGRLLLIDPYGWEGEAADPLSANPGQVLWEGFETPVLTAARIDPSTGQITITGTSFPSDAKVEVWRRLEINRTDARNVNDGTYVATCQTTRVTSATRIVAEGCSSLAQDSDPYVVKVVRPTSNTTGVARGPRSRPAKVTRAAAVPAEMLAPLPGSLLSTGATFSWSPGSGVRQYWLEICCFADGRRVYPRASQGLRTLSFTAGSLPDDGRVLTVKLDSEFQSAPTVTRSYSYRAPQRQVALRIDGALSASRAQGASAFSFAGSGFRPGRAVRRYLKSGTTVTELTDRSVVANARGEIAWTFQPTCATSPGTYTVWAQDEGGAKTNEVTEVVLAGACGVRWAVRVFNSDDSGRARLNGANVVEMGFALDSGFRDVTARLRPGSNQLVFELVNTGGAITYGFEVARNGTVVFRQACGTARVVGCNNNLSMPRGVARSFTYSIAR